MKKSLIALALVSAFAAPAFADEPASEHTLTGNVGLFSSYRFRGIDQTFGKPALQGGFDYSHSSGFYVGNWNSNVSSGAGFPEGNLEMDFYGGWKGSFGDFGVDVGAIYYYYPGSEAAALVNGSTLKRNSGAVNNKEIYVGASWKFVSLKYFHSIDDYFSLRGWDGTGSITDQSTKGTNYTDLSVNYDLGDGWGVNAHVGRLNMKNGYNGSYTDWKVGVTKDINGWVIGASYIDTNAAGKCSGASDYQFYCFTNSNSYNSAADTLVTGSKSKDAGRGIAVLSVSKTF